MESINGTTVKEFVLLGFRVGQEKRFLLFVFFSVLYSFSLVENIMIILLVYLDTRLGRLPMYILLSNFSWLEICYVSSTTPRILFDLTVPYGTVSFQMCFLQFYLFCTLGSTECFFISAMALDRYLAICYPLRYPQIMSPNFCYSLVGACWILGSLAYIVPVTLISTLNFCGPNIIDHFLCDPGPLLSLACPPLKYLPVVYQFVTDVLVIVGNFLFVLLSYGAVIVSLIKSSKQSGQKKAFSTISFHLLVVTLFYGPLVGMYVSPSGESESQVTKIVTVFYTAVTPFLNPLIYSLRNDQVKEALKRLLLRLQRLLRKKIPT